MDVSVIIVARNTCALTCDAIRSVLDSYDSLAREIFVVDNGSTDDTASVLARELNTGGRAPGGHQRFGLNAFTRVCRKFSREKIRV
jgi:glycosyltransferase involved in cell wall biosynthesis